MKAAGAVIIDIMASTEENTAMVAGVTKDTAAVDMGAMKATVDMDTGVIMAGITDIIDITGSEKKKS